MTLKTTYNATISLLTPLHIGSGAELRRDYDYVTHGRQTWMMDADAFLEDIYWKDGKFDDRIIGRPASELLQPTDFQPDSCLGDLTRIQSIDLHDKQADVLW